MADMQNMGRYVADGYSFYTERDAALAQDELKKVKYIEQRLDYNNPKGVLRIYNKVIEEHVFRSPVGQYFLRNVRQFLLERPEIDPDAVSPIPMYVSYEGEFRAQANPAASRIKPAPPPKPKKSSALPLSIILNILLSAAVIAMFVIALNADQPNILNYERVITDRYAAWEQELTEREQTVRERERELEKWKD